ncbi:hypothetical protein EBU71_10925, partial [bacterium]|nr:hypothetical protein [Candidatus Elulimicrobium humile]
MQFFYDGQIRRYILQTIRLLSNFVIKYGDGRLVPVPVMYGDMDRQVANVIRQNSENKIGGPPRIAVYVSSLEMDKERLADATFVGKIHLKERNFENGEYTSSQGGNYTVERLMPTPYKLVMKADIWTGNTDQKLQVLEQILMLFNPSLDIQTSDNYVDWTSLSVVYLDDCQFSSRSIPVGQDSPIDIATLTFSMPIWISPPAKVKKLGIVNRIVMSMFSNIGPPADGYIEGIGLDPNEGRRDPYDSIPNPITIDTTDYDIIVYGGSAKVFSPTEAGHRNDDIMYAEEATSNAVSWRVILGKHNNVYTAGESKIFLKQPNGTEVIGTIAIDPLDESSLKINWDQDTYPSNTDIPSVYRPNSPGTFDAIIDPQTKGPNAGLPLPSVGTRYLLVNNIGGGIRETLIANNNSNRIDTNVAFYQVRDIEVFVNDQAVNFAQHDIDGKMVIRLYSDALVD